MIPKHIMESKLITDEQWEEYMHQKAYIRQLETEQLRDKQMYQMQIDLLKQELDKKNKIIEEINEYCADELKFLYAKNKYYEYLGEISQVEHILGIIEELEKGDNNE